MYSDTIDICFRLGIVCVSFTPQLLELAPSRTSVQGWAMSAHGHNSISNCVRAARNGSEEASLFTELIHEPAPLKAKEQLLLQSLRAKGPHLQRKAAKAVAPRAAPAPAPAATQEAPRRVAPVAAKVFASKAERRHGQRAAWAPPRVPVPPHGASGGSGRCRHSQEEAGQPG